MLVRLTIFLSILTSPFVLLAQPTQQQAIMFGVRESVEHIDISPDGMKIVYVAPGPGRTSAAYVVDLGQQGVAPRSVVGSAGNPERLQWCNFVGNERLICQVTAMTVDPGGMLVPFSRLFSVNIDGTGGRELGRRSTMEDIAIQQFDGAIVDWLADREGAVLMSRNYIQQATTAGTRVSSRDEGLGVDLVDVVTGRGTRVERANRNASSYLSDGRGTVRIMSSVSTRGETGQSGTRVDYFYRIAGSRDWRPFGSYDSATREGIIPIAVDAEVDAAYALQRLNGRFALYRVRLDASRTSELVYANERVDVDGVVRVNRASRVIGVTYAEERRHAIYFDTQYERLAASLGRALPTLPGIDFISASQDGQRLLIHAGSDNDAGRYYVYDRQASSLTELFLARPQLENVTLATVQAVSYPAADGTVIPAYLTLPPGASGRNLPAVVLPHGGPQARDVWGFDWLAQYLAHIGYAVLQPNFRGSYGYGDAWLQQNGYQGWRTSIGDVIDGARWLASEGIADANRMAIVGWSYGGYAALQAGTVDPDLFKGIVAIAPVTDLQQLKDDQRGYTGARNLAEYVGSGPHVAQGSPLQNAERITAPVLMFHGNRDLNVMVVHSQRMDRELRRLGRQSEFVLLEGLEHDLPDSVARAAMLHRIGQFLAQATGR
jgi:dipeptidyl aminopeptidase/acylaminoacyl peptidase